MGVSAKIIKDSVNALTGDRLTTMEIELHRFILPEFNTHRKNSRNFQSSRALPLSKQRSLILAEPAVPVFWGKNQPGMVANEELDEDTREKAEALWFQALGQMSRIHAEMEELGVHKQIANRILEPFMYTKGLVTATTEGYEHFFYLRCHRDAQPEIQALANAMRDAYNSSMPVALNAGEWHLPYVDIDDYDSIETAIKVSVSCCAQVSYRNLDTSVDKALKIYDMLNLNKGTENPSHASPCEHQAKAAIGINDLCGNLSDSWIQYRKLLGV